MTLDATRDDARRLELGAFLRGRRDRIQPREVGLPVGGRRRSPGLLREEVAQAAGISTTWYTWMEQARETNPSVRVLDGLSRALRLDATERAYLFRLARPDLEPAAAGAPAQALGAALERTLAGLSPHPAYVLNSRWDVLGWNAPAALLFGSFDTMTNLLRRMFLDTGWRTLFRQWDDIAADAVGQFRATNARASADPAFETLVGTLCRVSPEFLAEWRRRAVRPPAERRKILDHPVAGALTFDYAGFQPDGADPDLRLTIYTPADTDSRERWERLLSVQ